MTTTSICRCCSGVIFVFALFPLSIDRPVLSTDFPDLSNDLPDLSTDSPGLSTEPDDEPDEEPEPAVPATRPPVMACVPFPLPAAVLMLIPRSPGCASLMYCTSGSTPYSALFRGRRIVVLRGARKIPVGGARPSEIDRAVGLYDVSELLQRLAFHMPVAERDVGAL